MAATAGIEPQPRMAIVIVTRNRCLSLSRTLQRLHDLELRFPIVVVDNNSQDNTRRLVRERFPDVRLIPLNANLGAVARDYGVRAVKEPYVAFADDDSWYAPGSLSRAIELFDEYARLGLLMSRVLVGPEERLDPMCRLMMRTPLPADPALPGYPILGFVGCGAVVRRSAYLAAGGYHQRFDTGGEEALLAIDIVRKGWALAYIPEVVSHHYASTQRNMSERNVQGECNRIWTIWLRRRAPQALGLTLSLMAEATVTPKTRRGFVLALAGLPWVLCQRDAMAPWLEEQLGLLERQMEEEGFK